MHTQISHAQYLADIETQALACRHDKLGAVRLRTSVAITAVALIAVTVIFSVPMI